MLSDFDQWYRETAGEVPQFVVGGQSFTPRQKLPHAKLTKAINDFMTDQDTGVEKFFRLCLIKADRDRFVSLLNADNDEDDDEAVITSSQVNEILTQLLEFYTGKKTPKEQSSTAGQNGTGVLSSPAIP